MIDTRYYNNTATDDGPSIDLEPGYQLLDGAQALGFVRFRHDQNGDFTRILRQQMFLRAMKRQVAASATLTSFPRLLSAATTMSQYLVSDISGLGKLYRLVSLVAAVDTSHIYQTSIAGSTPTIGGIDYVVSTPEQVQTAVHELYDPVAVPTQQTASGATTVSAPQLPVAKVALTVLNGSGVSGIAARATTLLRRAGYLATDGGNAASFSYATTSIACDGFLAFGGAAPGRAARTGKRAAARLRRTDRPRDRHPGLELLRQTCGSRVECRPGSGSSP